MESCASDLEAHLVQPPCAPTGTQALEEAVAQFSQYTVDQEDFFAQLQQCNAAALAASIAVEEPATLAVAALKRKRGWHSATGALAMEEAAVFRGGSSSSRS